MPPLNDKKKEPVIRAALDELVLGWPGVSTGKMFGSRSYRAQGVLFAMIGGAGVILTKMQPGERETAVSKHHARTFIGHGKEIPAWVEFSLEDGAALASIAPLVRYAYENALAEAGAA